MEKKVQTTYENYTETKIPFRALIPFERFQDKDVFLSINVIFVPE
ncbi:MAG: hypothetical protein R6V32_05700 [Bacteroidales bacterium]